MKLELKNLKQNLADFMRSAGYHYDGVDPKTKELRFYKSLSSGLYPRFHIYAKGTVLNLHLDQKAPVYEGSAAHAGEYEGPVIEKEAGRILDRLSAQKAPKIRPIG